MHTDADLMKEKQDYQLYEQINSENMCISADGNVTL